MEMLTTLLGKTVSSQTDDKNDRDQASFINIILLSAFVQSATFPRLLQHRQGL